MEEKVYPCASNEGQREDRETLEYSDGEDKKEAGSLPEPVNEKIEAGETGKEGKEPHEGGEPKPREPGERPAGEIEALQTALDELEAQKEEYYRLLQRLQADFENYRRRMNKEREELIKRANERLLLELLPVLDSLERALQVEQGEKEGANRSILEGIKIVYRQFQEVLAKEGVKPIPAVGEPFNPEKHEAVMQVENSKAKEGTIVEELRKGYYLHDKVLRPSMVKVAKSR